MKTRINQILFFTLFAFFLLAGNVKAEGTERHIASSLENSNNLKQMLWECYLGEVSGNNLDNEDWISYEQEGINLDTNKVQLAEPSKIDDKTKSGSLFNCEEVKVIENQK